MFIRLKKQMYVLPLILVGMGLGGCVSVLPEPKQPDALVRLPTSGMRGASSPLNTNIVVHIPDAMGAISGAEIAASDNQRIQYINDVRWADSPARLFQAAVVDALTVSEGDGLAVPVQVGARGEYDLRLSILDLTVDNEKEEAVCKVRVVLTRSGDKSIIASDVLQAVELLENKKSVDRAEALARAISNAAEITADFVATHAQPYDLDAERRAKRLEKRAERRKQQDEDAAKDELENELEPEEIIPEFPPEIQLNT
ncbi:ABC-type transport auxiliary lipoprotein family protein [Hirschia baltica]|uniref:ABC-type transport auxiliary lipoprotein component domain-containing protein n=1 Tax=Hirschia baltica (strain ATCC 49814 / DSM 5838 / IFAM 1418) TaxID=582402 RepID=C6XN25_HIRBI|nr:ABC-type transport auxiliary lipoprotein family protein [Hirschia baltica]ACT58195.1 hypothetical protein Hbal_0493 [Hirschia baltica ATCC 49814]